MSIVFCGICPHPPIVVPEVGKRRAGEVAATSRALLEVGRRVRESGAETLVMISPHSPVFYDVIGINVFEKLYGDLGQFGAEEVSFNLENDLTLAAEIKKEVALLGIPIGELGREKVKSKVLGEELDHGLMVPLYFLEKAGVNLPLVPISISFLSWEKLYTFGLGVRNASRNLNKKMAFLASGDLSHRLTQDAPAGYDPWGIEFDRRVVELIQSANARGLMELDPELIERAGECGLRPIIMMFGALDGLAVEVEVLSYEGPFGVGYLVASLKPGGPDPERTLIKNKVSKRSFSHQPRKQQLERWHRLPACEKGLAPETEESYLVRLARESLESYLQGESIQIDKGTVPEEFQEKAGVFVSIKKNKQLRGCIGTVYPQRDSIAEEVVANAISAGVHDPRFLPVRLEELNELEYSVDVLKQPEPVNDFKELNPKKYGVIVRRGNASGLLLPDLEGIETPEEQVAIARQKAGIGPNEPVILERFEVVRYK